MGKREMKDFTYYDDDKRSLLMSDCNWLTKTGLRETQWILDVKWLLAHTHNINLTFKEWINRK